MIAYCSMKTVLFTVFKATYFLQLIIFLMKKGPTTCFMVKAVQRTNFLLKLEEINNFMSMLQQMKANIK